MEVVVVGSLNVDLVTVTVRGIPKPGETIVGKSKGVYFGGKGANQAVACAKIGGKVRMVGAVGSDEDGNRIRQELSSWGVEINYVATRGAQSGFAAVTVSGDDAENTVIVVPGANALVSQGDLTIEMFRAAKVVTCQNEIPLAVTRQAFVLGQQVGATTVWNPAPPPDGDCSDVLRFVDILCVNEHEAAVLAKTKDLKAALVYLNALVPTVIITLGKEGCMLRTRDGRELQVPASPVEKVVDTTGAGDCFCGSLALFLARGVSIQSALELANQVASLSVTKPGAQDSYPKYSEVPRSVRTALQGADNSRL